MVFLHSNSAGIQAEHKAKLESKKGTEVTEGVNGDVDWDATSSSHV